MEKFQSYFYVGPKEILERVDTKYEGSKISQIEDIQKWAEASNQIMTNENVIATFVINQEKELVIADRHSEHVVCAGGKSVLSAGEITFEFENEKVSVVEITNQSTGYCPKPESWNIIKIVLNQLKIEYPEYFTRAFEFRLCENCQTKNLIKEDVYECAVCNADLDLNWNFDKMKKNKK